VVGSYTYTDAEYTTDTTYKGNTPAQVPKHMASLWGDYTLFDGALSGLTLGTGVRYTAPAMAIRRTPSRWAATPLSMRW
jgi:iron complex outermembrane receptor protein